MHYDTLVLKQLTMMMVVTTVMVMVVILLSGCVFSSVCGSRVPEKLLIPPPIPHPAHISVIIHNREASEAIPLDAPLTLQVCVWLCAYLITSSLYLSVRSSCFCQCMWISFFSVSQYLFIPALSMYMSLPWHKENILISSTCLNHSTVV